MRRTVSARVVDVPDGTSVEVLVGPWDAPLLRSGAGPYASVGAGRGRGHSAQLWPWGGVTHVGGSPRRMLLRLADTDAADAARPGSRDRLLALVTGGRLPRAPPCRCWPLGNAGSPRRALARCTYLVRAKLLDPAVSPDTASTSDASDASGADDPPVVLAVLWPMSGGESINNLFSRGSQARAEPEPVAPEQKLDQNCGVPPGKSWT